jgi:hypothetical protein
MLCLIAKGVHLEGYSKRTDIPGVAKRNAYKTFATELNYALNKKNYGADIDRKEITKMLDQLLVERKGVAGKGGLVERNRGGRVTRSMRMAWERNKPIDFDGSLSEWNQGRRERILNPGGLTAKLLEAGADQDAAGEDGDGKSMPLFKLGVTVANAWIAAEDDEISQENIWRQARKAAVKINNKNWRVRGNLGGMTVTGDVEQGRLDTIANSTVVNTNRDAFSRLPANIRTAGKYEWANPRARKPAGRRFDQWGRPAAQSSEGESLGSAPQSVQGDGYHSSETSVVSSGGDLPRPASESYVPPTIGTPDTTMFAGLTNNDENMTAASPDGDTVSPPALTHQHPDYSSSDNMVVTPPLAATPTLHARIQSSGNMTPFNLNTTGDDALAHGLNYEITYTREQDEEAFMNKERLARCVSV